MSTRFFAMILAVLLMPASFLQAEKRSGARNPRSNDRAHGGGYGATTDGNTSDEDDGSDEDCAQKAPESGIVPQNPLELEVNRTEFDEKREKCKNDTLFSEESLN